MSAEDAKRVFRKLSNTTTHCRTFGEKPTAAADYQILKNKRFAELEISKVLNANAIQILDKWLANNDQDEFTGKIYFLVREMATVVKNQIAVVPTSLDSFITKSGFVKPVVPRYDKIVEDLEKQQRGARARGMSLSHLERATAFKSRKFDLAINPQNRAVSGVQRGVDVDQAIINTKACK